VQDHQSKGYTLTHLPSTQDIKALKDKDVLLSQDRWREMTSDRTAIIFDSKRGIPWSAVQDMALDNAVFSALKKKTGWVEYGAPGVVWSDQLECCRISPEDPKLDIQDFCNYLNKQRIRVPLFVVVDSLGRKTDQADRAMVDKISEIQEPGDSLLILLREPRELTFVLDHLSEYSFAGFFICPYLPQNGFEPLEIIIFDPSKLNFQFKEFLKERFDIDAKRMHSTEKIFRSEIAHAEMGESPLQKAIRSHIEHNPKCYSYRATFLETFTRCMEANVLNFSDYKIKDASYSRKSRRITRATSDSSIGEFLYRSPDLLSRDSMISPLIDERVARFLWRRSFADHEIILTEEHAALLQKMKQQEAVAEVYGILVEKKISKSHLPTID
jgi:hypothetical protein